MVKKYTEIVEELNTLFDRDYKEFVRDRRRWKSDFDAATVRAANNLTQVKDLIADCVNRNELCFQITKMILDAQMITHLIDKQDIEDKKQIGLFGLQTGPKMLNPALADSVNYNRSNSPKKVETKDFE